MITSLPQENSNSCVLSEKDESENVCNDSDVYDSYSETGFMFQALQELVQTGELCEAKCLFSSRHSSLQHNRIVVEYCKIDRKYTVEVSLSLLRNYYFVHVAPPDLINRT